MYSDNCHIEAVTVGDFATEFHTMTDFCLRRHAICRGEFVDNQSTLGKVEAPLDFGQVVGRMMSRILYLILCFERICFGAHREEKYSCKSDCYKTHCTSALF